MLDRHQTWNERVQTIIPHTYPTQIYDVLGKALGIAQGQVKNAEVQKPEYVWKRQYRSEKKVAYQCLVSYWLTTVLCIQRVTVSSGMRIGYWDLGFQRSITQSFSHLAWPQIIDLWYVVLCYGLVPTLGYTGKGSQEKALRRRFSGEGSQENHPKLMWNYPIVLVPSVLFLGMTMRTN